VLMLPAAAIDYDRARGLHDGAVEDIEQPSGFQVVLTCRPLLLFAACAVLFHFANAAMLPLVGQKLALQDRNMGTSLMSACIVAAQIIMVPMAILVGRKANRWGRKPLFLAGFLVLAMRGMLYTLSDNSYWLGRRAIARWCGRWALWGVIPADCRRPHAGNGPLQCRPWRSDDGARNWGFAVHNARRLDCGQGGL